MTTTTPGGCTVEVLSFGTNFEESGVRLSCSCGWKIVAAAPGDPGKPPHYESDGRILLSDLNRIAAGHLTGGPA